MAIKRRSSDDPRINMIAAAADAVWGRKLEAALAEVQALFEVYGDLRHPAVAAAKAQFDLLSVQEKNWIEAEVERRFSTRGVEKPHGKIVTIH